MRAVEIVEALVYTRSRRHGDCRDIACTRIIVVEGIQLLRQVLSGVVALVCRKKLAVATEIRCNRRVVP